MGILLLDNDHISFTQKKKMTIFPKIFHCLTDFLSQKHYMFPKIYECNTYFDSTHSTMYRNRINKQGKDVERWVLS